MSFYRKFVSCGFVFCIASTHASGKTLIPEKEAHAAIGKYSSLAFLEYSEAVSQARALQKAIEEFVAKPTPETHLAAKKAWFKARDAYSPTEPFRFYGGPIDEPKTGPESLINAWPIDEAYLDYVNGQPIAGIINSEGQFPTITKDVLVSLNQKNGERNVSTGYHAIEFLLWGQDLSLKTAGQRPADDYDPAKSKTAARRGIYLKFLADLLAEQLTKVRDAWDPAKPENYGKILAAEPLDESLRKIYTGMTNLSIDEMAGERMTVALEKNDQENEQDCFSDYTLTDLRSNESGIQRIYFEGGIHDLVQAMDPKLAKATAQSLKDTMTALQAIPDPYDNVIASKNGSKDRKSAENAIERLQAQGKQLAISGKKLGLLLNVQ